MRNHTRPIYASNVTTMSLVARGDKAIDKVAVVRVFLRKKERIVEGCGEMLRKDQYIRKMWVYY